MEDIRLGRKTRCYARQVTISSSATQQVLGPNPYRLMVSFYQCDVTAAFDFGILPESLDLSLHSGSNKEGFALSNGLNVSQPTPLTFKVEEYGELVIGAWSVINNGGESGDIIIVESTLARD